MLYLEIIVYEISPGLKGVYRIGRIKFYIFVQYGATMFNV